MRRWLLAISISLSVSIFAKPLQMNVNAEAAILINADTGAILFEKNAHQLYYPASTTKIATALYALEMGSDKLSHLITADRESLASISYDAKVRSNFMLPSYWLEPGGTHIGILNDEKLSLRDLLFGMMVASGNDAANVIAKEIGGTVPDFMQKLNEFLKDQGCLQTTFYNPHGLHHPKHLTTPYDMAVIAMEALKYPLFREIVITERFVRPKTNKQEATSYLQTNHLVRKSKPSYYPKALGVKTGYISAAKYNLVAAAQDKGRTLVAVLFKCKARKDTFDGAIALFESAFKEKKVERVLLRQGVQEYVLNHEGATSPVRAYISDDVTTEYYPSEEPILQAALLWHSLPLPIVKGQVIGEIQIQTPDNKLLRQVPLYAEETVVATWGYWLKSFF